MLDKLCDKIYFSYVKKKIFKTYNQEYVCFLSSLIKKKQDDIGAETEFIGEINAFIESICNETIHMAEIIISFRNIYKIMRDVINKKFFGSYRKMICSIDDNLGLLPENGSMELLVTSISNNKTKNISPVDFVVLEISENSRQKLFYNYMNVLNSALYKNYSGQTYEEIIMELFDANMKILK